MLRIRELRIQGVVFLFLLIALASIRIFLSSSYFDLHPNPNKKVIIAFRNDDIQEFSGTKLEIDLFNLFKKSHIPQTYATVPFKTDLINNKGLITILKEHLRLGLAEIALHGYSHQNLGGGMKSEFMGMPYKEQCEKITEGKNYLEELFHTKIFTFVPPFNAYDLNTTEACYKNGIIVLSSSNFFPVQNNHKITPELAGISILPILRRTVCQGRTGWIKWLHRLCSWRKHDRSQRSNNKSKGF